MDVGIFYNRGTEGNAAVWYDASDTRFKLSETRDPFSNTTISQTSAANLTVGAFTTSELTIGAVAVSKQQVQNLIMLTVLQALYKLN